MKITRQPTPSYIVEMSGEELRYLYVTTTNTPSNADVQRGFDRSFAVGIATTLSNAIGEG